MGVFGWICIGGLILLALLTAAWLVFYFLAKKQDDHFRLHGEPVIGWIIQANNVLYDPKSWEPGAHAQVMIIDAPDGDEFKEHYLELAETIAAFKDDESDDENEQQVIDWVTDERVTKQWRKLPKSVTGGLKAYLVNTFIERKLLPDQVLVHPFVRMLVIWDEPNTNPLTIEYRKGDRKYRAAVEVERDSDGDD